MNIHRLIGVLQRVRSMTQRLIVAFNGLGCDTDRKSAGKCEQQDFEAVEKARSSQKPEDLAAL